MFSRLFDRWSKSRSFTSTELAILRLFLPIGPDYSERLYSQATNAPYVERKLVGKAGYEAIIPYVIDDSLLIECDENIDSPMITATTSTGMAINFSTTILRGGFLRGLRGQVADGTAWPRKWVVDFENAKIPSSVDTWLPSPIGEDSRNLTINRLLDWCGIKSHKLDRLRQYSVVRVTEPASSTDVRACEARLAIRLGEQYLKLVSITNGFGILRGRPYEFLGTFDLDYVKGDRKWICLTPLYEEGCVAIRCENGIASNECYLLSETEPPIRIGDIKLHALTSLLWDDVTMQ